MSSRPGGQTRGAAVIDAQAVSAHVVGERVFHQKFGYGAIIAIEGDKLEIAFEKAGVKMVYLEDVLGALVADGTLEQISGNAPPIPTDPTFGPYQNVSGSWGIYPTTN